jgi:hypothetical protein
MVLPMRIARPLLLALALGALLAPATAVAQVERLYDEYKRTGGQIDACAYSAGELSAALGQIPADVRAYDPGFADALNLALDEHVAGCGKAQPKQQAPQRSSGTAVASDGSPGPANPAPTKLATATEKPGFPAALVAVMVLLGVVLGLAAGVVIARYYGWRPPPPRSRRPGRRLGERLADGFWVLRDRLGR